MQLKIVLEEIYSGIKDLNNPELEIATDSLISRIIKTEKKEKYVFVYGAGRSGYLGRAFVMRLVQCGFKAHFLGESSTPIMRQEDMLLIISGSGKTSSVEMIVKSARANSKNIYLITSQPVLSKEFKMVISIKGKNKLDKKTSLLPLGSLFEINAFLYMECLIAKIIDKYPPAKKEIEKVSQRYNNKKMIVF